MVLDNGNNGSTADSDGTSLKGTDEGDDASSVNDPSRKRARPIQPPPSLRTRARPISKRKVWFVHLYNTKQFINLNLSFLEI